MATIGFRVICIGLIIAAYFFFNFDPTVPLNRDSAQYLGVDRVYNVGLMHQQQMGLWFGIAAALAGTAMMIAGYVKGEAVDWKYVLFGAAARNRNVRIAVAASFVFFVVVIAVIIGIGTYGDSKAKVVLPTPTPQAPVSSQYEQSYTYPDQSQYGTQSQGGYAAVPYRPPSIRRRNAAPPTTMPDFPPVVRYDMNGSLPHARR